jgi:hypothetical protein
MHFKNIALALPLVLGVGFTQSSSPPGNAQGSQPGSGTGSSSYGTGSSGSSTSGMGGAGSPSGTGTSTGQMGSGQQGTGSEGAMGSSGSASATETPSAHVLTGRVTKASKSSLSIQTHGGKTQTLALAPETQITVDGQDAKASDIKAGQDVRASYNDVAGKHVALKVDAMKKGSSTGMGTGSSGSMETTPGGTSHGMNPPGGESGAGTSGTGGGMNPPGGQSGAGTSGTGTGQ